MSVKVFSYRPISSCRWSHCLSSPGLHLPLIIHNKLFQLRAGNVVFNPPSQLPLTARATGITKVLHLTVSQIAPNRVTKAFANYKMKPFTVPAALPSLGQRSLNRGEKPMLLIIQTTAAHTPCRALEESTTTTGTRQPISC